MNSIHSTGASKDGPASPGKTIRLRDAGNPEHLNVSRSTVYDHLRNDPDFRKLVPVIYYGNVPHVFVNDIATYKAFKRQRALASQKPRVGRPRKNLSPAAE